MGNYTSAKICCCEQINVQNEFIAQYTTKHPETTLQLEPANQQQKPESIPQSSRIGQQEIIEEKDNNEKTELEIQLPPLKIVQPKYFEIYLTPDQSWLRGLENNLQPPINIDKVYRQLSNVRSEDEFWSKKIVRRSAHDNKKIQLLFKQHIPTIGKYFFEVDLISYLPNKKCDFTIGVVNYHFARDQIHSRDSSEEQSHTFIERKLNIDQKQLMVPVELNLKFQVEITREEQPQIAFYIDGKLQKRQALKKSLQNDTLSLVPYIQTQYQGVVIGWKSSLKRSISSYRISTIFEEPSSIISV